MKTSLSRVRLRTVRTVVGLAAPSLLAALSLQVAAQRPKPRVQPSDSYTTTILPLLRRYCLACHSAQVKKGGLDLARFATVEDLRRDTKPWQGVLEQLHAAQMPPSDMPQPTAAEKQLLLRWVQGFLDSEARARADDPGSVPVRRLSNTEYDNTIRELTGIDLQPTREFPADGAAGEGFTNAAEALSDISPALLAKYLNAAKDVADHAVLLSEGIGFSPRKTRSDWTNASTARLQQFYAGFVGEEGRLLVEPYVMATIRHRDALKSGTTTIAQVAAAERLNAKYLGILYTTLTGKTPSVPLEQLRTHWRQASVQDAPKLLAELKAWQNALWRTVKVSNYLQIVGNDYRESATRQVASEPPVGESVPVRVAVKPTADQAEVVLYLSARALLPGATGARIVWQRPRFEAEGSPPLLLSNYPQFGPAYEVDYPSVFANSAAYLAAAAELAQSSPQSAEPLAKKYGLDTELLQRWSALLGLSVGKEAPGPETRGRRVRALPLTLLDTKLTQANQPAIHGWHRAGQELPAALSNASDTLAHIPGTAAPHSVVVHPSPQQFVAAVWKSPFAGPVRVSARLTHAHPSCGNGVAWWIEHRRGEQATVLAEGTTGLGGTSKEALPTFTIAQDDQLILAVDAHSGDHTCDLTDVALTVTEADGAGRVWDLAGDIADTIRAGNPHADRHGNSDTWSFVQGPTRAVGKTGGALIPPDSVLGRWHESASRAPGGTETARLAQEVQALLSRQVPPAEKTADRLLYDNLVSVDSPLFTGLSAAKLGRPVPHIAPFGLAHERFTGESLTVPATETITLHLPAALLRQRSFVVEGKLDGPTGEQVIQLQVQTSPPGHSVAWDGQTPLLATRTSTGYKKLQESFAEFRQVFPLFLCFPNVIPNDEVVSLKMFHREDEPLQRLFLSEPQSRQLEKLWADHALISQQAIAENAYLPQFIGFVTQDGTKEALAFFQSLRTPFQRRADAFLKDEAAAVPKHLAALLSFAEQAYRRPCTEKEKAGIQAMYAAVRAKGASHDEAIRGVLARVLVAPAFLFRIEKAPASKKPPLLSDWELATRLSYFLWSGPPDSELRSLAAHKRLQDPKVLKAQVDRMLQSERLRALAVEFGTQWVHVRNFDTLNEKNEKLFPTFDATLRKAIYEESILFFQDMFRSNRPVTDLLSADDTFLNETLAKHYGIPGVSGQEWRRVKGVKKYGRGGILGLASVQTKQAGASRTSPILRGNWVVETLLGEKLPRPPANIPRLPEEEGGAANLTVKQLVEKHSQSPLCSGCHQRIDPFGFALERYDPIGRWRTKDLGGLPIDTKARLKDGTTFEGMDGLRTYLLTQKRAVVIQVFCRRLLGYALGRSVTLSDTALLNQMAAALQANNGRLSAALYTIVCSPQFRRIRGSN